MKPWTLKENVDLIQKADEYKHRWSDILPHFPNRSIGSLKTHYSILKKTNTAVEENIDTINVSAEESADILIKNILNKKITNHNKILQLKEFNNKQTFQTIIMFSKEFQSSCVFLSILLQKMFDDYFFPKNIFLEISKVTECKTLLQFCRTFSVLKDEELINIDYIQDDMFFFNGPIFEKKSRENNLIKARKVKKENAIDKTDLQIENARLSKTIFELNGQIDFLTEKVANLEEALLKSLKSSEGNDLISKNIDFILPSGLSTQFPMLVCMINKFLNKVSSDEFYKFCILINILNTKAYVKLRDFLPLLSLSSCYEFISPIKISIKDMLLNYEFIPNILHKFYNGIINFDKEYKAEQPIFITLGGDAASLKNFTKSSSMAIYVYQMCPLKKYIPTCVVHMMESRNGSSPQKVVDMFSIISDCLCKYNFIVKFKATDGDFAFDDTHRTFFKNHIEPILDSNFLEIVDKVNELIEIPVSDPMHLIKCAKSRLLQHLLLIDPDSCKCVNTALFSQAVQLGPVFNDKSTSGSMKDKYALLMFSWYSFIKVLEKGRFDAAFYILPYMFFIEAFRSPLLSNESRLEFLSNSFEIFKMHLKKIREIGPNSMFKQRFSSKALGVLFGDEIFLIRMMNTCIALGVAVKYFPESLATQRVGTHDLELFFGTMRLMSFYDNDFSNAIRVAAEAIIIRQFSQDLNCPIKINKRENEAGITLTDFINSQPNLDFDGNMITDVINKLMKGQIIKEENLVEVERMINNYTRLMKINCYKCVKMPNLMSGTLPSHRYNVINYSLSVMPINKNESTFDYYLTNKRFKKKIEKLSVNEWSMKLVASLHGINHECIDDQFKIPFDYDLDNEKDIERIIDFITEPLQYSKAHAEIFELKKKSWIKRLMIKKKVCLPF